LPSHWHLVLWSRRDGELSRFMRWLTLTHAQRRHAHRHRAGEQLVAWMKTPAGSQFDVLARSTVADVKSAIDKWANDSAKRLEELKDSSPPAQ
jgi:hypothetical protein